MRILTVGLVVSSLLHGCMGDGAAGPCAPRAIEWAGSGPAEAPPYRGSGNPYEPGPLAVHTATLERCELGTPVALRVHAPERPGTYAVVVFQHGFLTLNSSYDTVLRHVASHGFVVAAPQMYVPGVGALLGSPSAAEEASTVAELLDWLPAGVSGMPGVLADTSRLGLAGHSRGGKVVWLVLAAGPERARAVAAIDPVDGRGGPLGRQARAVQGATEWLSPAVVLGTGLGGACAPAGDNHEQFYAACSGPAWHVVAVDAGHADMLEPGVSDLAAQVCATGSDRAGTQRLTAGLMVALFRARLQGDEGAYAYLSDAQGMPGEVYVESKAGSPSEAEPAAERIQIDVGGQ